MATDLVSFDITMIQRLIGVMLLIGTCACGETTQSVTTRGVSNEKTATEATVALQASLKVALLNAGAPAADAVRLTIACDSGTATVAVSEIAGGTVNDFSYNACKLGSETLSGNLRWTQVAMVSASSSSGYVEFDGALAYEGATYAGNFGYQALRIAYTTTPTAANITTTGSYTIGGTRYTIDETAAVGLFQG